MCDGFHLPLGRTSILMIFGVREMLNPHHWPQETSVVVRASLFKFSFYIFDPHHAFEQKGIRKCKKLRTSLQKQCQLQDPRLLKNSSGKIAFTGHNNASIYRIHAAMVMSEMVLGGALLCAHTIPHIAFIGGCLLAIGLSGAWMLALQNASQVVLGRAAGRMFSLAGFAFFIELFIYMGTLMGTVPAFSAIFWSKFWLFTLLLLACLVVSFAPTFLKIGTLDGDASPEATKTTGLWLAILIVLALV